LRRQFDPPAGGVVPTVASQALAGLGTSAISPVVRRAGAATEEEWRVLARVLRVIKDQGAVRQEICAVLDSEPGEVAEERLDRHLHFRPRATATSHYMTL
jgi:hypothetical protein